jgi:SAM-dependent methyltransferase
MGSDTLNQFGLVVYGRSLRRTGLPIYCRPPARRLGGVCRPVSATSGTLLRSMGILHSVAEFLVRAKAQGVCFERMLTLGRQNLFVSPIELGKLLKRHNVWPSGLGDEEFYRSLFGSPFFADPFFKHLGTVHLDSMDYSDYEGASVIHDMNQPIPPALREEYDLVFDGGTLEHVFNFPIAIKNCMEMLKPGGRFIAATPANSYFGHGFYQFSAELFFRVFSPQNGFEVERIWVKRCDAFVSGLLRRPIPVEISGAWYEVTDPAAARERVLLSSRDPVLMFVQARRVRVAPVLETPALQSDYVANWEGAGTPAAAASLTAPAFAGEGYSRRWLRLKHLQLHVLPRVLRVLDPLLYWRNRRRRSLSNTRGFSRVK